MANYTQVKTITKIRHPNACVLNYEDPILRAFGENLPDQVLFFSSERKLKQGLYLEDETIWYADESETCNLQNTGFKHRQQT